MRYTCKPSLLLAAAAALAAAPAHAAFINDPGFFSTVPTTFISFENNGAGAPVNLIQGQTMPMPADEYASLGVLLEGIGSPVYWVNDGNAAFDVAQSIGGTPSNAIPSSLTDSFTITFTTPVQAFGFFVVNNRGVDPAGPVFVARDAGGAILETVTFSPTFVDGTITAPTTTADYGFMGIFTPGVNIASVTITKDAAILDTLTFSPIPAPGVTALAGLGALLLGPRRRR